MKKSLHKFDFCVVGGGMAGMIAAIAAARRGVKVALVHDRPVLGGNASSEIRMNISGAHGPNNRETGILEEIQLENHYRNFQPNFSIWDSVLHGKAAYQENLTLFLNCSVSDCKMNGNKIESVTGWQLTTETWHTIEAKNFADCSGDGILAPLSGAEFRVGREAQDEYNESIAPEKGDKKTMGLSCLFQAREYSEERPFIAPDWANKYTKEDDLRGRDYNVFRTNFWWIEVGGEMDSIHDAEACRDELLKIVFGVFDYIKNYAPDKEKYKNVDLEWVGFLPGKRESRRYIGDHVMTQLDVETEGKFDDIVAYGGWSMDDHFPEGFYHPEGGTIFHEAPSPFGISYRTLYSRNIENLYCAGRNHSATHAAMSATRVMGTTSLMGQAVGTAVSIANRDDLTPREVYETKIGELQQKLMDDDCYLPWHSRNIPEISKTATVSAPSGDPSVLVNGIDRPIGETDNGWTGALGESITISFDCPKYVSSARMVFDSDLNRVDADRMDEVATNVRSFYKLDSDPWRVPHTLVKGFKIEVQSEDGSWSLVREIDNNYQRLVNLDINREAKAVRLTPLSTWGAKMAHLFAFDVG